MFNKFGVVVKIYVDGEEVDSIEQLAGDAIDQVFRSIAKDIAMLADSEVTQARGVTLKRTLDEGGYQEEETAGGDFYVVATINGYAGPRDREIYVGTVTLRIPSGTCLWNSHPLIPDV